MFSNIYDYAEIAYEEPYVDGPDAGEDEPDNVPEENPEGDLPGADPTGGATVVSYGGKTIALVGSGKTNVLVCMGKMMKANVEVKGGGAAAAKLQTKTFTANGTYPPDSGYDGFSKVTVDVAGKVLPKYDGEVIIEGEPESGGGGGGLAINGIIREYKVNAGANVNAGDFVEFVTRYGNGRFGGEKAFSYPSICELGDNRVVLAYRDDETTYGMAVVFSIENGEITIGEAVAFNSQNTSYICLTYLSGDKVIVTYNNSDLFTTSARILTISETFISMGDAVTYYNGNTNNRPRNSRVVVLDSTTILISVWKHGYGTAPDATVAYLMRISDTTMQTINSATVDTSYTYAVAEKLSVDSVIVVGLLSSNYPRVYFLNMNGDTVTPIAGQSFNFKGQPVAISKINENSLFFMYAQSGLKARILTVNGDTVNVGEESSIGSSYSSYAYHLLSENKAIFVYQDDSNSSLCKAKILTINEDNTITVGEPSTLNNVAVSNIGVVAFSETSALIVFYDGYRTYSSLTIDGTTVTNDSFTIGTYVQPATSSLHNIGVAKTGGTEGETVEVYCVEV